MGLMKELNDLNDIYQKMYVTEVSADKALEASKKADVERGKAAAAGDKERAKAKAGQAARLYKAQAKKRLNKEDYETKKKSEVLGAMKKQGRKLSDKEKNKIADKVVKDKGDTSKSDDRYAYESVTPEVEKLIESGKFSDAEIVKIADIQEADIADILAQLEKKRIRQGGNQDESPLGKKTGRAMKAQQDKARSKK